LTTIVYDIEARYVPIDLQFPNQFDMYSCIALLTCLSILASVKSKTYGKGYEVKSNTYEERYEEIKQQMQSKYTQEKWEVSLN